ncbi:MAG TPA: hypothetical protein VME43_14195 [Bryobacteraceae bacterium]|nr:hypothetical protein [Bryobacteraceae bacterium]
MATNLTRVRWTVLAAACLGVLALPALLLWNYVRPAPWDARVLRVRFESVRYEAAALVFTYSVENRAWRSLRLLPEQTEIRLVPAGGHIPAGFPNFAAPLLLEGHSSQRVELRIDLPADPTGFHYQPLSDENTRSVLAQPVPGITAEGVPGSPLPLRGSLAAQAPPEMPKPEELITDALQNLNGFELVNPAKGVDLLFPRGW